MAKFSKLHITSTLILVLGLFLLSANAMADDVERYDSTGTTQTASGSDIGAVQTFSGEFPVDSGNLTAPAEGDVIKISGNATFLQAVNNTYTVRTFTIQSANENQQTITVGSNRCYDLNTASQTYNFTFENLFFQGNNTAIYSHGRFAILSSPDCTLNLTLNNVTFKQFKSKKYNDTTLGYGGVIHIANDTNSLILQGSSADMIDNSSSRGGALSISAKGLTSTVNYLTFKNNSAADDAGGAIYSNGPLSFTADNLTFESNSTAASTGGAIHADSGKLTVTADTLAVKSNSAKTFGGGIYSKGATSITANSLLFESNTATNNNGGAIYMDGATLSISGDTIKFKSNVAKAYSGAIYSNKDVSISGNDILFEDNHVSGNDGGAVWSSANVTITGTTIPGSDKKPTITFDANYSAYKAGALYAGGTLTLNTGTFEFKNNKDNNSDSRWSHGGAIYCASISTDATEIKFDTNSAKYYGGAMYTGGGTLKADTITFNKNSANSGGGVYNNGTQKIIGNNTIEFTENTSSSYGGGIYNNNTLTITGKTIEFSKNSSSDQGGAIYNTGSLTITGDTIKFTENHATTKGGAIYNLKDDEGHNATVTITGKNVLVSKNYVSNNDGGAIFGGNVNLEGKDANSVFSFEDNYTKYYAAAISTNTLTINTGTFNFTGNYEQGNSSASYSYGGAVNCTSITANAKKLNFDSNTSKYYGGGLSIQGDDASLQADTIIFNKNKAEYQGGAIFGKTISVRGETVSFTDNQVTGTGNSAMCGGAIYSSSGAVTFGQNGDYEADYGVYTISGNSCYREGGAIFASGNTTLNGKSFTFTNNTAETWVGGAIRVWKSDENLQLILNGETEFTGNKGYSGGAIYIKGDVTANQFATFKNNASQTTSGGAICTRQSAVFNKGTLFSGNTATTAGGAIYADTNITFAGTGSVGTFTNNAAGSGKGNDLYLDQETAVLTFQDAGTYSFDGGIYLNNANAKTVINQAQVTIAGRENTATNNYQLQNVTISNGGSLTANLDYINSLTGTFNVGTAETAGALELNVSGETPVLLNAVSIVGTNKGEVKKTGDGTLQIYTAAAGLVDVDSFVVSSGRLDMKEFFTGTLEIGEDLGDDTYTTAIFSPGNSVGDLTIDGTFTLHSGSTLFIEQEGSRIDTLSATTVVVESNSILDMPIDSLQPGMSTPIIQSTNAFGGDMANDAFWNGLLTSEDAYYWNLKVVNGNTVMASVDANAVPEPSTWALLVLGAAGLLYWRKRK